MDFSRMENIYTDLHKLLDKKDVKVILIPCITMQIVM